MNDINGGYSTSSEAIRDAFRMEFGDEYRIFMKDVWKDYTGDTTIRDRGSEGVHFLMREVSGRLSNAGYNSAMCKFKWRSSLDIPSGEHSFFDVVNNSSLKKEEVRVIIEMNFRDEFEMA
ncbi:hypothetical protein ACFX2I_037946 [Malus domestica]